MEIEQIIHQIYTIRGVRVMIDSDLAQLYKVETKVLNQAVKRNIERFPTDFMFQLTNTEWDHLKSQTVTSSQTWGGRRTLPHVFSEQGVAMLSGVLKSKTAIEANITIMRAFVSMRKLITSNNELNSKISALEIKYDKQFKVVFDAIRQLIQTPIPDRKKVGFK